MKMITPGPAAQNANVISKEEWASTLFGERGLLSGIFQMLDQQKKIAQSPLNDAPDSSGKINSNSFDFKRIVDALFKGADGDTFGDPGPELPEFLGLCNRLSCGDIYKKRSINSGDPNFSVIFRSLRPDIVWSKIKRFQTALSLIHDPNGWETIGNLLSNPELISQFTAGTGMEELFGSALGTAKKESAKTKEKNSKLTPEDGDFGIEFTDGEEALPKVDFSVDGKPEIPSEDYYEQVSESVDEVEPVTIVATTTTTPTTTTLRTSSFMTRLPTTISSRFLPKKEEPPLPEISFSIDGDGEESEIQTIEKEIDIMMPPSSLKKIWTTTKPTTYPIYTTRTISTTTTTPTVRTTPFTITWRQTTRNHRKDSDYYAMYYDQQP
ncbi:hypothetical protein OSTOST_02494 [Ostertagia ostertagi]